MQFFQRLHGRQEKPGLELRILKRLPKVALVGVLLPVFVAVLVRAMPSAPGVDAAKHIRTVDIIMIATAITFLTAMFTVAIGAIIVYIMKGPAYVAEAYPLSHADRPAPSTVRD